MLGLKHAGGSIKTGVYAGLTEHLSKCVCMEVGVIFVSMSCIVCCDVLDRGGLGPRP